MQWDGGVMTMDMVMVVMGFLMRVHQTLNHFEVVGPLEHVLNTSCSGTYCFHTNPAQWGWGWGWGRGGGGNEMNVLTCCEQQSPIEQVALSNSGTPHRKSPREFRDGDSLYGGEGVSAGCTVSGVVGTTDAVAAADVDGYSVGAAVVG